MRSLSNEEYIESEAIKTKIFFTLDAFSKIDEDTINNKFNEINNSNILTTYQNYKNFTKTVQNDINRELTAEENKFIKAYFYEMVYKSLD